MPFELKDGILYIPRHELEEVILMGNSSSYAGGGERAYKPTDRGTLLFRKHMNPPLDAYTFEDEFWGDYRFAGNSLVRTVGNKAGKSIPLVIWSMVYMGSVVTDKINHHTIFEFLREPLKITPIELPFRGPIGRFVSDEYPGWESRMKLDRQSNIESGAGRRTITYNGEEVYWEIWSGGISLQNKGSIILI